MQVANVNIVGNIGSDPELRQTGGGLDVLNFSVAVNSKRRDEESTAWYRVAVFGSRAQTLSPLLSKGQSVYVCGRLEPREYTTRDGGKGVSLDLTASDVILVGGREAAKPASVDMEEVPF